MCVVRKCFLLITLMGLLLGAVLIGTGVGHPNGGNVRTGPRAVVGVYYFDGWDKINSQQLSNNNLMSAFASRKPLTGWLDNTLRIMRQELAWAHRDGISFFVFDYYYYPRSNPHVGGQNPDLNNALHLYKKLRWHSHVHYALLYVNGGPFVVSPQSWHRVVTRWITRYFQDPSYQRINGKPVLVIINIDGFAQQMMGYQGAHGRVQSANRAIAVLQSVARAHGLPGIYVLGGGDTYPSPRFQHLSWLRKVHIQAMTLYNYPCVLALSNGPMPYRRLMRISPQIWMRFATKSHHLFLPVVMDGWDPRPWNEHQFGYLFWFRRSPADFERFAKDTITFVKRHQEMQVTTPPHRPVFLIEAWNELGEGSYMVPTVGDHNAYGQALAHALGVSIVTRRRKKEN